MMKKGGTESESALSQVFSSFYDSFDAKGGLPSASIGRFSERDRALDSVVSPHTHPTVSEMHGLHY
jgi:hypothetical protein